MTRIKFMRSEILRLKRRYWELVPYECRPSQLWYRLKCFLWHRYTTVKPRYLAHTWCDRTEILPHVMFEVLAQFLEKECSPGIVDWDSDDEHRNAMKEMRLLDQWWKDYQKIDLYHEYIDSRPGFDKQQAYRELNQAEEDLHQQLKWNCKRLVDLMDYLWT